MNNLRDKTEMGEYIEFLVDSGYALWDESVGAYVFVDGVDTTEVMNEYMDKQKKGKHASTG
jgi:hypothetical protein